MATDYFFNNTSFLNTIYSLNIALEKHFAGYLLKDDLDRVVYSSTNYALRKRSKGLDWDVSFLPFLNYKMEGIGEGADRSNWSASGKLAGIWVDELKKYIKFTPITITYDATAWYRQHLDNLFALTEVIWDDTSETIIDYTVDIKDIDGNTFPLQLFGILGFNFSYNPAFDQSDWLNENKIFSNTLNFEIQTYIIKEGPEAWIPETVVFEFAHSKGLDINSITSYDEVYEFTQDYFNM